ncbi:hypothetical protein OF83DRAFT_1162924 [Amylostereum chailletii]|nr:hypothetical protein OF83DRAFT_1162924 [Amylostereum chailletii]
MANTSLSSVVSNLMRAQMGSAVSSTVTDDDLDRHVAELILKEAKQKAERYGKEGYRAFLPPQENNAPRPNKRFLSTIIRSTDDHNKSLLRAQALSAAEIRAEKEEQERKERRARAEEAVAAEHDRRASGSRRGGDRGWDRSGRKRRDRSWERRGADYGDEESADRRRRRRSDRRPREDEDMDQDAQRDSTSRRRHRRRDKSRSPGDGRREETSSRRRSRSPRSLDGEGSQREHHRKRRHASSSRDRTADSDDNIRRSRHEHDRSRKRHRRRSRSVHRHRSRTPDPDPATPRSVTLSDGNTGDVNGDVMDREADLRRKLKGKAKADTRAEVEEGPAGPPIHRHSHPTTPVSRSRSHHLTSSHSPGPPPPPLEPSDAYPPEPSAPAPPLPPLPPRSPDAYSSPPRHELPSKMDRYFEPSYDPRLDVAPLVSTPHIPATGLVEGAEFEGWDAMLELIRARREDKLEKKRLERLGLLPKDKDKKKDKDKGRGKEGSGMVGWSEGVSVMDIAYKKRGSVREWDLGKETPT